MTRLNGARSTCQCGKRSYLTRKDAKAAARRWHAGDHMSPYMCEHGRWWHIGHLAPGVLEGRVARADLYSRPVV